MYSTALAQEFIGFRLGMSSDEVFAKLGRSADLSEVPILSGKKILNDTIPFPSCLHPFRRSVGFNPEHKLIAVGLTHRTDSVKCEGVKKCVLNYLIGQYGLPDIDTREGVVICTWKFEEALITLDAKAYNERDWFVLVYFFERRALDLTN